MLDPKTKIWRPFTQMKTAAPTFDVSCAKDAILTLKDGRKIIDAISSWWVITHGHCQQEISIAISEQCQRLDQTLFANFSHVPAKKLVEQLSAYLPQSLSNFFFTDNGSTAVEAAIKMLIQRWYHLGEDNKNLFLSFEHSYHGDTVGAMSVGGDSVFNRPYKELLFRVLKVKQGRLSTDSIELFTQPFLEALERHYKEIAGIIIEPLVQGAGGMIVWPKEALEIIGKKAKEKNIPLIFDEVMTGFGRTGSLFAFNQLTFYPDIICLSKGLTGGALPLSLTIATDEIYNSFLSEDKAKMFFHGHSFTGNPISCAAACANLDLLKKRNSSYHWKRIENIHRERISGIKNAGQILDKRLCGTICALELSDTNHGYATNLSEQIFSFAMDRGVFLRPLGNIVYLLPPYSITDEELHRVWDVIDDILNKNI